MMGQPSKEETVVVFAVQCPNANCRKYMLVEEHDRGKVIPCLICKTPIQIVANAGNGEKKG